MKKYEYVKMGWNNQNQFSSDDPNWNGMGKLGWELVSVVIESSRTMMGNAFITGFFKRELP